MESKPSKEELDRLESLYQSESTARSVAHLEVDHLLHSKDEVLIKQGWDYIISEVRPHRSKLLTFEDYLHTKYNMPHGELIRYLNEQKEDK